MNIIKFNGKHVTKRPNRNIKYIVIHYTANTSSKKGTAYNNCKYFNTVQASADFVVDNETIYQYNPDIKNYNAWHCGDNQHKTAPYKGICTNSNSIGIELCSSNKKGKVTNLDDGNWYFTDAVLKNGIELVKHLMKTYNISTSNIIRHRDVTGKCCPSCNGWYGDNKEWKWFKEQLTDNKSSSNQYTVEVKSPDGTLNLREEPNANSKLIQVLKNGDRVIIVGQKGDWLQTNWNRWLNGKYTKVVD